MQATKNVHSVPKVWDRRQLKFTETNDVTRILVTSHARVLDVGPVEEDEEAVLGLALLFLPQQRGVLLHPEWFYRVTLRYVRLRRRRVGAVGLRRVWRVRSRGEGLGVGREDGLRAGVAHRESRGERRWCPQGWLLFSPGEGRFSPRGHVAQARRPDRWRPASWNTPKYTKLSQQNARKYFAKFWCNHLHLWSTSVLLLILHVYVTLSKGKREFDVTFFEFSIQIMSPLK